MPQITINQVILKKYRVVDFIAAGGMGAVYKVYDLSKNVNLAMKVMNFDFDDDPSATMLFKRDAKALRTLSHPNIVPYYGFEQTNESMFLFMSYIDGDSLKGILKRPENQPFPIHDTLVVIKALCAALGYAHFHDVVHCDIKPGNILVDQGGNVFLTDFGIARHADSSVTNIAGAGTSMYMAPEQFEEKQVTAETDIYGLGVVLFEMLTGQKLFRGREKSSDQNQKSSKERIREAHLTTQPIDPRNLNPKIPETLSLVVLKALSKAPEDRYHSTQQFFTAICEACNISKEQIPERINPNLVVPKKTMTPMYTEEVQKSDLTPIVNEKVSSPRNKFRIQSKWKALAIFGVLALFILMLSQVLPLINNKTNLIPSSDKNGVVEKQINTTSGKITPTIRITRLPSKTSAQINTPTTLPLEGNVKISTADQMRMVFIPEGEFLMGSSRNDPYYGNEKFMDEIPQHEVFLNGFWISETEITNRMFQLFVDDTRYVTSAEEIGKGYITRLEQDGSWETAGASWRNPYGGGSSINGMKDYPVVQVSWLDASAYCDWIGGRLPTEAEWEKAARGSSGFIYPWGDTSLSGKFANSADRALNSPYWSDMSVDDGYKLMAPVKSYPYGASPYGLYDMAGNAWEWVSDWYDSNYYQTNTSWRNPQGPTFGDKRVLKGGSIINGKKNVRSAKRLANEPNESLDVYGFRCVQP